jgi:hypothetical protein
VHLVQNIYFQNFVLTQIIKKIMHTDFNVRYYQKKFQNIMLIFACCTKIKGSRGRKGILKIVETQANLLFFSHVTFFLIILCIVISEKTLDYYVCELYSYFYTKTYKIKTYFWLLVLEIQSQFLLD